MRFCPKCAYIQFDGGPSIYFDEQHQKVVGRSDISDYLKSNNQNPFHVSRQHFTIFKQSSNYYITDGNTSVQDKESSNKTQVNGKVITGTGQHELKDGDTIKVAGLVEATFHLNSQQPQSADAPPPPVQAPAPAFEAPEPGDSPSDDSTILPVQGNVWIYAGKHAGKYIEKQFFGAKKSAHVCAPWISEKYVVRMKKMADNGVDVKIITQDNHWNTDTTDLIRKYNTHSNFNYRIFPKDKTGLIHTKLYIIDGEYAVFGSANFTKAALWGANHELITISDSIQEAKIIEGMFSKLWKTKS